MATFVLDGGAVRGRRGARVASVLNVLEGRSSRGTHGQLECGSRLGERGCGWLVGIVDMEEWRMPGNMCLRTARTTQAEPWTGPRCRDGRKEELMKQLEKKQLEVNCKWNRESFKKEGVDRGAEQARGSRGLQSRDDLWLGHWTLGSTGYSGAGT